MRHGEIWGNTLTSNCVAMKNTKLRKRLAMGQHGNVACEAFAHVNVSGIQVVFEKQMGVESILTGALGA